MTKYNEVKRVANVGERIKIVSRHDTRYENGDVFVVERSNSQAAFVKHPDGRADGGCVAIFHSEYAVLEPVTETPQAAEDLASLSARLAAVEAGIAELKRKPYETPQVPEAALTRDEIVEMAKADVKDLRKFKDTPIPNDPGISFWPETTLPHGYIPLHIVKFVVNRAKRTVVAVIHCKYDDHTTRGIAKCAPDDVFNSHIGRAIALHRALGLPVPDAYLHVPQPTEPRVGDVVKGSANSIHSAACGKVTEIGDHYVVFRDPAYESRHGYARCFDSFPPVILDDSREEVSDVRGIRNHP